MHELRDFQSMFTIGAVLESKNPEMADRMKRVRNAIRVILSDTEAYPKSLNYAVNYCRHALSIHDPHEMKVQCLYILGNITKWRHPKASEVRGILKKFTKEVK